MSAFTVGKNIQNPMATRTFMAYRCHSCTWWVNTSTAMNRMIAPRAESSHIIRWRRSSRSMSTPVKGNSSIEGMVCRAISKPNDTSE